VKTEGDTLISQLTFVPTGHYFRFGWQAVRGPGFYVYWWPCHGSGGPSKSFTISWAKTMDPCPLWLRDLRSEVDAPDLWAGARAERTLVLTNPSDNSSFTPTERELVVQHLQTIKTFLDQADEVRNGQHEAVVARLAFIEEKMKYLEDASKRLGRIDWKNATVSTLMQFVLEFALPVEKARELLALAGHLLGPLFDAAQRLIGG
jgi:hypothetical protein